MPNTHKLLACLVAVLWGMNFLAIHASLDQFPPLLSVAIRFAILAVPTLLFVPRPQVRLRWLIGYGLGFGVAQMTFLYLGMALGAPAGLASLVLQASGPFTLVLGAMLLRERVLGTQWIGIAIALSGMALVGVARAQQAEFLPFLLVLLGGLGWAFGNLANRLAKAPNALHLTLWMSVVVPIPMVALSLIFEGPERIATAVLSSGRPEALPAWLGIAYTVVLATVAGSGVWTWLMARHPAGVVAPFSMLVPVVGIASAALILGERPGVLELVGGAIVVAGVLIGSIRRRSQSVPALVAAAAEPRELLVQG